MRILVFGSSGLFGSSLVPYLQQRGHEVFTGVQDLGMGERIDLTNAMQANAVLNKVQPEVIVNLVALTNVDECERKPQNAYMLNVRAVENIARWMQKSGSACHLIQMSTDHIYDGEGPHKEENLTLTNYYAFSKYAGELLAASVPSTILRTNFFGPSKSRERITMSDWLVRSLRQGDSIVVFDDVYFSPLTLQSLVQFVELAIIKQHQGVFNLGSKNGMSKADFCFTLAKLLDLPVQLMKRGSSSEMNFLAYRPKDMRMDSSRFEKFFGVELPTLQQEIQLLEESYGIAAR